MDIEPVPYECGQVGFPPTVIKDGETTTIEAEFGGNGLLAGEKLVVAGLIVFGEAAKRGFREGATGIIESFKVDGVE